MAVFQIFSQAEQRRYYAHVCSKASIFMIFVIALTFIPPFFIAYRSYGFWLRVDNYEEQPQVQFKHQLLVTMETSDSYITWSTFQNYNQLQQANLRIPVLQSREADNNGDGVRDELQLKLEMPLLDTEHIQAVQLILIFDYMLSKFSTMQMESMGYLRHESIFPGGQLKVIGDLLLVQRQPLAHRGLDTRFNTSIFDRNSLFLDAFDLSKVFTEYSSRNVTTLFQYNYPIWSKGRAAGSPFTLQATVRYPLTTVQYTPGLWQLFKWAWIQYFAILVVFIFVFNRIKAFVYQNQLVTTIVIPAFKEHKL
ncbi:unnamed protein product [Owenia fusiformis]|uniref:Transmembrane protein 231 n=1 Tax=Owenia fusiformis TaxID=6347 RepID=A0A8J1UTG3_OWEFU|nr:unnamed protein product [Owenia fusiformis]